MLRPIPSEKKVSPIGRDERHMTGEFGADNRSADAHSKKSNDDTGTRCPHPAGKNPEISASAAQDLRNAGMALVGYGDAADHPGGHRPLSVRYCSKTPVALK